MENRFLCVIFLQISYNVPGTGMRLVVYLLVLNSRRLGFDVERREIPAGMGCVEMGK